MKKKNEEKELMDELKLMVAVFIGCIMTSTIPARGSPCHIKARELVEKAKSKPKVCKP